MLSTILKVLGELLAAGGHATTEVIASIARSLGLSVDFVVALLKSLGIL